MLLPGHAPVVEDADLAHAERVLASARAASGAAAYAYFFGRSTPEALGAYLAALRAELEAEEIVGLLRAARDVPIVEAPGPASSAP